MAFTTIKELSEKVEFLEDAQARDSAQQWDAIVAAQTAAAEARVLAQRAIDMITPPPRRGGKRKVMKP